MAIGDDFAIAANGDITHVANTTNYTVLAFHRWLQDLADDAEASSGDYMDITTATPSERSTDNIITLKPPYNVDDTAVEFLYDGSISQLDGATVYAGLVVVGAVETGTELQITQDEANLTSHWSTGKNADAGANILNRVLVKVRDNDADIDGKRLRVWSRELGDTYAEFNLTCGLGNNTAAIFTGADLNNTTLQATIATWTEITNTEGYQLYDISDDGANEAWYSQWDYGVRTAANVYEWTKNIGRRGSAETIHSVNGQLFRGITHQFDYSGQTTGFTEDAIVVWGVHITYTGQTANFTVGEYLSFSGGAVGKLLWQNDGGATGSIVVMVESAESIGTAETITGLTSAGDGTTGTITDDTQAGGSAIILADDDNGASGTLWVQLISGTAPATTYTLYQRGSTAIDHGAVNGAATARTVSPEFIGTYTGSAFIGAYGIGVAPSDGIAADQFFELTAGTLVQPPNNQSFTVFGLISGDRVLVTNDNGGIPDFAQRLTGTAILSGVAETTVNVTVAISSDTPSTGWLRVETDAGYRQLCVVESWTGSVFTITAEDFSGDNAAIGNEVMFGYIDKATITTEESFTAKYSAPRTMFVRVRDGGASPIKTFETTATFGSGGGSATAIRTSDA